MDSCEFSRPLLCCTCKIIVLGDSGVGKSSLTQRFCTGHFPAHTQSTIGVDFREMLLDLKGKRIKVQLWDTAGQERFRRSMGQHYYRNVHGIVFVYDVTNVATFRSLVLWMEECQQHSLGPDVPRVLVGNKADLVTSGVASATIEQARRFAEIHSMPFYLCSAKGSSREQVDVILSTLAQSINVPRRREAAAVGSFKLSNKAKAEKEREKKRTCNC